MFSKRLVRACFVLQFFYFEFAPLQANELAERVLRFPEDRSIGLVYLRPSVPRPVDDWMYASDWQLSGDARGQRRVDANTEVRLDIGSASAQDLSVLQAILPEDIQAINLRNTALTNSQLEYLGKLTGLRWLDLQQTQITDAGMRHLKALNGLIVIQLDAFGVSKEGFGVGNETLRMMALGKWNKLESISLRDTKVSDDGIAALVHLKSLKNISLAGTIVTDTGIEHLKRLPFLETLSLGVYEEGCQLTDVGMVHVGQLIGLKHLDLSGTKVTDEGAKQLRGLRNLKSLSIDNTKMSEASFAHLESLQNLTDLRAYLSTEISDSGVIHLAKLKSLKTVHAHLSPTEKGLQALSQSSTLEDLSVQGPGINDDALKHMRDIKSLKVLWLQHCPITDEGLASLGELENLERLLIGDSQITLRGFTHLKRLSHLSWLSIRLEDQNGEPDTPITLTPITEMKQLRWLVLRARGIASRELMGLNNLENLTFLELDLDDSSIDDDVARCISEIASLEHLRMQHTVLSDKGLSHLSKLHKLQYMTIFGGFTPRGLKLLEPLKSLNYLQIASPFITEYDAGELSKAIPSLQRATVYETFSQIREELSENDKDGIRRQGRGPLRIELDGLEGRHPPKVSLNKQLGTDGASTLKLETLRGKVVLVYFFSVKDTNLIQTLIKLRQLHAKYRDEGFEIVAVHSTENAELIQAFITEQKLPWPIAVDDGNCTAEDWSVKSFPSYFLIEDLGMLRMAGVHFPDLEKAIRQLLDRE